MADTTHGDLLDPKMIFPPPGGKGSSTDDSIPSGPEDDSKFTGNFITRENAAADKSKIEKGDQKAIGSEIETAMAPEQAEVNALPGEYESVMSQLNALPGGTGGDDPALNKAIGATEAADKAGESGVETALGKEGPAVSTLAKDLPYADVLSTSLQQKKNELLYGVSTGETELKPSQKDWSSNLKDIYSYIEGNIAGSTPQTQTDSGLSGGKSPTQIAEGQLGNQGVPGADNAGTGGSGGL